MYTQDKRKLDPRCENCVFIGYDKNSPAYIIYFPNSKNVQKHRLVKFMDKTCVEQQTETLLPPVDDFVEFKSKSPNHRAQVEQKTEVRPQPELVVGHLQV